MVDLKGRIALLGDTHFGVRGGDLNFLMFQLFWFKGFLADANARGIKTILQAGDFFDVRKSLDQRVLHHIVEDLIPLLRQYEMKMVMIVGNHDIYYRNSNEIYSGRILELIAPDVFKVYSRPAQIGDWLLVPWLDEYNASKLLPVLEESRGTAKYVMGHFEIEGAQMYTGNICEHGLSASVLQGFEAVFSGHFHCVSNYMGIQYLGTPYHLTWADFPDGTNRGWWVFEDGNLEFVVNEEFMTLFAQLEYDPEHEYKAEDFESYKGNIIKVIVRERPNERHYKKFVGFLNTIDCIDFKVIDLTVVVAKPVEIEQETLERDTLSVMREYIEKQPEFDVAAVSSLAEEVYLQALNLN